MLRCGLVSILRHSVVSRLVTARTTNEKDLIAAIVFTALYNLQRTKLHCNYAFTRMFVRSDGCGPREMWIIFSFLSAEIDGSVMLG